MECTEVFDRLSEFLDGELEHCDCAAIEAHIATCPSCANLTHELKASIDLCRGVLPEERPRALDPEVREQLKQAYERHKSC